MELEGLKRCLDHIQTNGIAISELAIDRHIQVKTFMQEQNPEIRHSFDVWHVAKDEQITDNLYTLYCMRLSYFCLLPTLKRYSLKAHRHNQVFLHKCFLLVCTTWIDVFSLGKGNFGWTANKQMNLGQKNFTRKIWLCYGA